MTELQQKSIRVKEALQQAVSEALEHKRRLGQYAVIFKNGKPVRIDLEKEWNSE
ncbi:MAG: hypothetical protein V3U88_07560 [Methylococcales bacterium]